MKTHGMTIPPKEMAAPMERVAKYMRICEAASRMANQEMEALFAKYRKPKLTAIDGGKK